MSIHYFISSGKKAGPGSFCVAIVLPVQVLVGLEWQKRPLRRRFRQKFILAWFPNQYSCMPLLGGLFIDIFSRPAKRKGSSSSNEPRFILEDAIHAPESSSRGANDKPAHVFEVRICKSMDDSTRSPTRSNRIIRVHRSHWSLPAIRTKNLFYIRATRRISIRK
jgi:hypothetical protein